MTPEEIEDSVIRSLDTPLTDEENAIVKNALAKSPFLMKQASLHKKIRETLLRQTPSSFGKSFAAKLTARIENTGVVVERQIFSFFKKYQLLAAGVIVGLLILNTLFSQQATIGAVLGLEEDASVSTEEIVSFDFYQFLNKDDL